MKKTIFIIILLALIAVVTILFLAFYLESLTKQKQYLDRIEEQQIKHLENIGEWTDSYNFLYSDYKELNAQYYELAEEKGFNEGWELYTISAYTSLDDGCNSIASTGINIEKLSALYNFAAVDPDVIPYGSVILVKFDTGIEPFLSVDCGGAIQGKRIDLYFVNDLKNAFQFGTKDLEVKVIR